MGSVSTSDFDVEIEFINEDPNLPENDPDGYFIEIFSLKIESEIEDFGIGHYEYGSEKCNDVSYQYEVNEIEFIIPWPENLQWLASRIYEMVCDKVAELDCSRDDDYYGD